MHRLQKNAFSNVGSGPESRTNTDIPDRNTPARTMSMAPLRQLLNLKPFFLSLFHCTGGLEHSSIEELSPDRRCTWSRMN